MYALSYIDLRCYTGFSIAELYGEHFNAAIEVHSLGLKYNPTCMLLLCTAINSEIQTGELQPEATDRKKPVGSSRTSAPLENGNGCMNTERDTGEYMLITFCG